MDEPTKVLDWDALPLLLVIVAVDVSMTDFDRVCDREGLSDAEIVSVLLLRSAVSLDEPEILLVPVKDSVDE